MEFSMMKQEKGDCLIEVAAWVGLTVSTWPYPYCMLKDQENFVYTIIFNSQTSHNFMFLHKNVIFLKIKTV
jgi:hypothetical protein